MTKGGYGLRFSLDPHREISTRAGRRFAKMADGDEVVGVLPVADKDILCVVSSKAHVLLCKAEEAALLAGPGRGVTILKVEDDDAVVGFGLGGRKTDDVLVVELDNGKKVSVGPGQYTVTARGGKGHALARKAHVARVSYPEPPASSENPSVVN